MSKILRAIAQIMKWFRKALLAISRFLKSSFRAINRRKRYAIPFYTLLAYFLTVAILIVTSGDSDYKYALKNKRVNDVTALNPIQVNQQIRPTTEEEIIEAIRSTTGPISIGGGRYSMGGQTAYENSLHIDMRQFNQVLDLNVQARQVTVQPGIVWRDLQRIIDPHNLSIKIMQTYANFTVGGSISVNCHGRYIGHGPIVSSVLQLKIITASGEVVIANRTENVEIFKAAVGGYGGIGVIVEATLQLDDNTKVERQTELVNAKDYNSFFENNIRNNDAVIFQNGDLYPPDYMVVNNVSWVVTDKDLTDTTRVTPEGESYWLEARLIELASWGDFGKWTRQKIMDPLIYRSESVLWRNKEASYDVMELEPKSREKSTYVLQEYFIPVDNIQSFIPKMREIYDRYDVNIMNVSLRHAHPDSLSYLSWAREEVFAFVVYYKQGTDEVAREKVRQWTVEITDAILSEDGAWYLPYQPHATVNQFKQAYPNANDYFRVKNQWDPDHRFTNKLLDKYNPYVQQNIGKYRDEIKGYYRDEEQSVLTVPEWYLVFNPREYADFLEAGNHPSDFPFYASIIEYWKLYDRSLMLVSEAYPENDEYKFMLQVIGLSVTLEYTFKIIYENTLGRLFGWFFNGTMSDEERIIVDAQRAYSDFIYHTAWYEFDFMLWVKEVWAVSNTAGSNWLRKTERKLLFTLEFSFKAAYARLIEWGAKTGYEAPVTEIFLMVETSDTISTTSEISIIKEQGNQKIMSITRWGPFTENIIALSQNDINIQEIGGNDEIVVSVIMKKDKQISFSGLETLYESSIVTDESLTRLVCLIPVNNLLAFLNMVSQQGAVVEHVFDY
jgi:FAD/FMN-containing dehydrogenase